MPCQAGLAAILLLSQAFFQGQCKNDDPVQRPAMGYNPWNAFHTDINETVILETIDLMAKLGLVEAGYTYFNLDDGWSEMQRDSDMKLVPSSSKFPSGIKHLAEQVHQKGMKLGIYSDAGAATCMSFPASLGHEEIDAATFASWEVDFLKYDNCYSPPPEEVSVRERYEAMSDAIKKSGRPMLYSMCEWGVSNPWLYGKQIANSWRTNDDISLGIEASWRGILDNLGATIGLSQFAGPGGWNDADMLEVGLPGSKVLPLVEQKAHFALWAIIKSPLLIGADLRLLEQEQLKILKASEVIALNQDSLGVAGDLIWKQGPNEIWATILAGGDRGVILFNRHLTQESFSTSDMTVHWTLLGLPSNSQASVRDLFLEKDLGTFKTSFTAAIQHHGVLALRIHLIGDAEPFKEWRPWHCGVSTIDQTAFQCLGVQKSRSTSTAEKIKFSAGLFTGAAVVLFCYNLRLIGHMSNRVCSRLRARHS